MALPTPDMDNCCKKERCLSGPNAGKVYGTGACDPCQGQGFFDEESCDCLARYVRFVGTRAYTGELQDPFTPIQTQWFDAEAYDYTIITSVNQSCEDATTSPFCGDPLPADRTPYNEQATLRKTTLSCTGGGGAILLHPMDKETGDLGVPVVLSSGLSCLDDPDTSIVVDGSWEFTNQAPG